MVAPSNVPVMAVIVYEPLPLSVAVKVPLPVGVIGIFCDISGPDELQSNVTALAAPPLSAKTSDTNAVRPNNFDFISFHPSTLV